MGIEFYYSICGGSCSYLRGDIFGIGLQYIGIAFMVVVIILSIIKKDLLLLALLSAGVGVEIYLVGFQIWHSSYCVYCLIFGGVLVVQFFLNVDREKNKTIFTVMAAALLIFPIVFHGSVTPIYAAEVVSPPTFGQGPIKVRLYADYFCPPCRALSPKIAQVLADMVKRNIITLTFIDTPFYQYSSVYARYFLYAMEEKKDIDRALTVRNVLFSASGANITNTTKLEEALKNKDIAFKTFEVRPIFDLYGAQLQSDKVEATPSCVIEQSGKKELFVGEADIPKALEKLLK
jgi:thiol:disulfide interchange protein DsbA